MAGLGWRVKNGGNEYSDGNVNPLESTVGRSVKAAAAVAVGAGLLLLGVAVAVTAACSVDCISAALRVCERATLKWSRFVRLARLSHLALASLRRARLARLEDSEPPGLPALLPPPSPSPVLLQTS